MIGLIWCEWRESNPHAQRAQDFKSRLSAYSNTLASKRYYTKECRKKSRPEKEKQPQKKRLLMKVNERITAYLPGSGTSRRRCSWANPRW